MTAARTGRKQPSIRTLWAIAKSPELHLTDEDLHAVVYRETGKESMKMLTQGEVNTVARVLQNMKDSVSRSVRDKRTDTGGGIRTMDDIEERIDAGVFRVIIGSRAAEDPSFAAKAAARWKDRIAVSIDARGDEAAVHGWTKSGGVKVMPLAKELLSSGVSTIIYTDISKDGMLTGPNFEMLEMLQALPGISLIASGGVSSPDDLKKLQDMGIYGAICGKALYEGRVTMEDIRKLKE